MTTKERLEAFENLLTTHRAAGRAALGSPERKAEIGRGCDLRVAARALWAQAERDLSAGVLSDADAARIERVTGGWLGQLLPGFQSALDALEEG